MNLKKNALFYSFSSYNGIFPESLLIVQISQIYATTEENWIALYLFFKLIQAPQVVFLRGFFFFIVVIWRFQAHNRIENRWPKGKAKVMAMLLSAKNQKGKS